MNNNLKQIIYRLDFDTSKNEDIIYNDDFLNTIMRSYKKIEIDEIENVRTLNINKENPNVLLNNEQVVSKVFTNAEGTSQLKINKNCLIFNSIIFNENLKNSFKDIVDSFVKFNEILSNDPENSYALYYRGMIYEAQEKRNEAIADLKKAYSLNKEFTNCNYLIASDYDALGKYKEAYNHYLEYANSDVQDDEYKQYAKARAEELKEYAAK